ncbi:MAG: trigger factor [Clostridia bacterium]|nr:trigger factor [Clostridia bacterium]
MNLKNTTNPEKNVAVLEFVIDKATFDAEVTKVFEKKKAEITLPGFRRGKAPRHLIEKMYGAATFYDDALAALVPPAYEEALKESGVNAVSGPEYDIKSIDEDGVTVTAKVFTKPEINLEGYKGLELTRKIAPVTDEEVENALKAALEKNARVIDVEGRPVKNGDTVTMNYKGMLDGVAFEGGTAENADLKLGSGQFIPGFEDQVEGHNIGESFDINVTFPEEYGATELAGKAVVFHIDLLSAKETILPEADDEFAKDVSDFDTIDEYKADLKAKIEREHNDVAMREVNEKMANALGELVTDEIPEVMFDSEVENLIRDYDGRLRSMGMKLDDYLKYTGGSLDSLREEMRPRAIAQVKTRLALEKVAEIEKVEVSEEEVEAEFKKIADSYQMEVDQVKMYIAAEDLKKDLEVQKAADFVRDNAVITDAE